MDYNNDERYWNINLLNKWFAISSILFLLCFIWMFYHDNDDEFKRYQREFRKLSVTVSQEKLQVALDDVKDILDGKAVTQSNIVKQLNNTMSIRKGKYGHYVFYKTDKMKKPKFISMKGCKVGDITVEWVNSKI